MNQSQVLIIGSGPAGLTAGMYAARALLYPVIVEGHEPGGQLTTTTDVENFPGFVDPISGPVLMQHMRKQAERLGVQFKTGDVVSVDVSGKEKKVKLGDGSELSSPVLIVATGASAKWLGIPSEEKMRGRGVSACATCDGFFFKGKTVAVVGGGDTALQDALYLSRFCPKVYVIHRRNEFRASKVTVELVKQNPSIELVLGYAPEEILGEQMVSGVKLEPTEGGEVKTIEVQGVFIAIGHKPSTDFLKDSGIELDEKGYMKAQDHVHTNVPGVFAAGDCEDHVYRQGVTAAGFGCMAALAAEKYLQETNHA